MLDLGITCLCVCRDQCVIEAEQPAFMQGVWEVIGLLPDPQYRHLGICIRFGAFPGQEFLEAVESGSEASEGFLTGLMRLLESFLDAPDRSGALRAAPGGFQDAQGRPGKAQTLRL